MNSKKIYIMGTDDYFWSLHQDRRNIISLIKKCNELEITSKKILANGIYCVYYETLLKPTIYRNLSILKKLKKIKLFAVITNDIRNSPEKITKLKNIIDVWIAPSTKIYGYIFDLGLKVEKIPFLVNKEIFKRLDITKKEICEKFNINFEKIENRYLIGSFQRDSLGNDLSKPKWQKNPDLLIEILRKLSNEKYLLILAGPRRHYIINQCKKLNLPYYFIGDEKYIIENKDDLLENNLSLKKINLLYNLIDFYIVTSKSEGGPKAILESALTKTLIFSTDVGLAKDILHPNLIFTEEELLKLISNIQSYSRNPNSVKNEINYNYYRVSEILDEKEIIKKIINLLKD